MSTAVSRLPRPGTSWPLRRRIVAVVAAIGYTLLIAIPTDLIDNPVFSREIPPTWWSWPALVASSTLAGLLTATYVRVPDTAVAAVGSTGEEALSTGPPKADTSADY